MIDKEVIKEAVNEVLDELEAKAIEYMKDNLNPTLEDIKNEVIERLKVDAHASNSVWVKIRAGIMGVAVKVVYAIIVKVIDKAFSESTTPTEKN